MADLGYLKSQLNYWKRQLNEYNDSLRKYKQRKRDVESVITYLKNVSNNNSSDVNNKLIISSNILDAGINYSGKDAMINSILSNKKDQGSNDENISSAHGQLQRELSECNRKIDEYQRKIDDCKSKIREYSSAVSAEESRQRQQALKKFFGG